MAEESVSIRLAHRQDYQFVADFGAAVPALLCDEPAPLGSGEGPSPVQLLLSAVANCLAASLLFALRKFKLSLAPAAVEAAGQVGRDAQGRLRVLRIDVRITLDQPVVEAPHLDRVLGQFESFCTVTQSVAQGIPVQVEVFDADGTKLK